MKKQMLNKEIKINVKEDEDATSAIKRYMRRNGFTYAEKSTCHDLIIRQYFHNEDYYELVVSGYNYSVDLKSIKFTLSGQEMGA
jgi:hypothetical protein